MTIDHLNTVLIQLRTAEALGEMPAGAMRHIQAAIERVERKINAIEKMLAAA